MKRYATLISGKEDGPTIQCILLNFEFSFIVKNWKALVVYFHTAYIILLNINNMVEILK